MICSNCGSQNKENAKFCFKCGTRLEAPPAPVPPVSVPRPAVPPTPVQSTVVPPVSVPQATVPPVAPRPATPPVPAPHVPAAPVQTSTPSAATNYIPAASTPVMEDLSTRPLSLASLIFKETNREIQLPFRDTVVIGRMDKQNGIIPDIDLTGIDKGMVTSRKHGCILYSNGNYKLKDMGSMNGTFLNGTRLGNNVEYDLKNGDEIKFGKLSCTFKCIG